MAKERHSGLEDEIVTFVKIPDAASRRRPVGSVAPPRSSAAFSSRAEHTETDNDPALSEVSVLALDGMPEDSRYLERAVLGEGGMGKLFLTRDERVGRDIAMKV